ncbi:hypothetical protein TSUD_164760 [Trifolium subterraneum]|uniref:F-box domain-containing protein n=1 Tax=Trifolium subterraneum TaxID=3900 RepID=A0A2Z6MAQ2_TRISU|nr:hypothetical protein TSUD_164760 [Trifolium subterraneum]
MISNKTIRTLTSSPPSFPTLPFDLIPKILSRLPVKLLLQFQCVCKSWNSLISDPKFAKKHLSLSNTTYSLHCLRSSYSFDSVLTNVTAINVARPQFPSNDRVYFVGSYNGILCVVDRCIDLFLVHLWNPSIGKVKELPPLVEPQNCCHRRSIYGFGYDPVSDNYKVVVVLPVFDFINGRIYYKNNVKIHTLGTDSWKNISVFPFAGIPIQQSGQYVSGTINWLACIGRNCRCFIASLDLGDESYQECSLPDCGKIDALSVYRDCLCLICGEDVWTMKEYGNKESWIKLFTISNMRNSLASSHPYIKAKYVFEDDQVLFKCWSHTYISYDFRNGTSKLIEFEDNLEVCVESLISPCF